MDTFLWACDMHGMWLNDHWTRWGEEVGEGVYQTDLRRITGIAQSVMGLEIKRYRMVIW